MPGEIPAEFQNHQLTPFERYVIRKLAEIESDVKTLLTKPDVSLEVKCCPCPPLPPVNPAPPAPAIPIPGKGDTKKMITYPVTVGGLASDVTVCTFHWTENSGAEQTTGLTVSGGSASGSFSVADAAAIDYWADCADAAGNVSLPSAHGTIASASDTTPPPAPATPVPGPGDTAPSSPVLGKGVKKK